MDRALTPERVLALLESAIVQTGGTHTVGDVLEQLEKGALQLWLGKACVGVTEIVKFPRKTAISIFLAAGDMAEFKALQGGIEAYGRGRGATFLMFHGRATRTIKKRCGWGRSGDGFNPGWVLYTKDI